MQFLRRSLSFSLSPRVGGSIKILNEKMRNFDDDDDEDDDDDDSDDSEGEFADEGDWYASLIAGERVGEWLDVIEEETKQQRSNDEEEKEEEEEGRRNRRRTKDDDDKRFRSAIEQLTKHVEEDEVYELQFGESFEQNATDPNNRSSVERDDFAIELALLDE